MGNRYMDVQDAPQTCRPGSPCDLSRNNQIQDNSIFNQIQRSRCSGGSCTPDLQITDCSGGSCSPRSSRMSDSACSGKAIYPSDNNFGGKEGYDAAVSKVSSYDHKNAGEAIQKAAASGNGVAYMVVSESTKDSQKLLSQMSQMKEQNPGMQFVTIDKDKVAADLKANPNDKNAQNWQKWIDQSTNGTNLAFTSLQSVKPGADGKAVPDRVVSTHWGGDIKDSLQDQNRFAQKFTGAYKDQFKFADNKEEGKGDKVDNKPKENLTVDEIKNKLGENQGKKPAEEAKKEHPEVKQEEKQNPAENKQTETKAEVQKQPEQKQEAQKPEPPKPQEIKTQLFAFSKQEQAQFDYERDRGNDTNFAKRQTELFDQALDASMKSGKPLVVNFEMLHCPPCNAKKAEAIPQMQKTLDGRAQIANLDPTSESTQHLLGKLGMSMNDFPNGFPASGVFKYDAASKSFKQEGSMINGYYRGNPQQFLNEISRRIR